MWRWSLNCDKTLLSVACLSQLTDSALPSTTTCCFVVCSTKPPHFIWSSSGSVPFTSHVHLRTKWNFGRRCCGGVLSSVIPAVTSQRLSPKGRSVECSCSQAASAHPRTQHQRSRRLPTFSWSFHFGGVGKSYNMGKFAFDFSATNTTSWPAGGYKSRLFFPRDNVPHTLVLTLQLSGRVDLFIAQLKSASRTSAAETDVLPDPVSWKSVLRATCWSDLRKAIREIKSIRIPAVNSVRVCGGVKSGSTPCLHCLSYSCCQHNDWDYQSLFWTGLSLTIIVDQYWSAVSHVATL